MLSNFYYLTLVSCFIVPILTIFIRNSPTAANTCCRSPLIILPAQNHSLLKFVFGLNLYLQSNSILLHFLHFLLVLSLNLYGAEMKVVDMDLVLLEDIWGPLIVISEAHHLQSGSFSRAYF